MRDAVQYLRIREADGERRQQEYESGKGPCNADIEQHALAEDRGPDADERAQGAGEGGRRQKVRQARIHPVVQAREVVSELMRQQDGEQGKRKRKAPEEKCRLSPERFEDGEITLQIEKGQIAREVVVHRSEEHTSEL